MARRKFKKGDIVVRTRDKWDGRKVKKGDVGKVIRYVSNLYGTSTNFYRVRYIKPSGWIKHDWCEPVSCLKKATGKHKDKYWLYKFSIF